MKKVVTVKKCIFDGNGKILISFMFEEYTYC